MLVFIYLFSAFLDVKEHKSRCQIDRAVYEAIRPAFEALAEAADLKEALGTSSTNRNESLHSKIAQAFPKEKAHGELELAIALPYAIASYNDGLQATVLGILRRMHMFGTHPRFRLILLILRIIGFLYFLKLYQTSFSSNHAAGSGKQQAKGDEKVPAASFPTLCVAKAAKSCTRRARRAYVRRRRLLSCPIGIRCHFS